MLTAFQPLGKIDILLPQNYSIMKKISSLLVLLTSFLCHTAFAQQKNKFEQKKTFEQSYTIDAGDKISINNKFGSVKILPSATNEVKVNVEVVVGGSDEKKVQQRLDGINFEHNKKNGTISFETTIKDRNEGNQYYAYKSDKKEKDSTTSSSISRSSYNTMEIIYIVQLPLTSNLKLKQSFGNVEMEDFSGSLVVDLSYGKFFAKTLSNVVDLTVKFGRASIKSLPDGAFIDAQYSPIDVEDAGKKLMVSASFCNDINILTNNSLTALEIKASYSDVNVEMPDNANASFSIQSSYGDVRNRRRDTNLQAVSTNGYNNKNYSLQYGDGSGAKVVAKMSFGKLKLR
jgi:hypothetical protein